MPAAAIGSHTVFVVKAGGDHVSEISGSVQKRGGLDRGLMAHGDKPDRRANARAQYAKWAVALLLEPAKSAANVEHRLPPRLHREADVRTDQVIRARVFRDRAAIVIRQAHLYGREPELVQPQADVLLLLPARVPLREDHDRRSARSIRGTLGKIARGPDCLRTRAR